MADAKWSDNTDFVPQATILATDRVMGLRDGGNIKSLGVLASTSQVTGLDAALAALAPTSLNQVHYSPAWGIDNTDPGRGSESLPYATYDYTRAAIVATGLATASNQYEIVGDCADISIPSLIVEPFISVLGAGKKLTTFTLTDPPGVIEFSPRWEGVTNGYCRIKDIGLISTTGISLNTTAFTAFVGHVDIQDVEVLAGDTRLVGKTGHTFTADISRCKAAGVFSTDVFNCSGSDNELDSFQLTADTRTAFANLVNQRAEAIYNVVATNGFTGTMYLTASTRAVTMETTGASAAINADAVSYITPTPGSNVSKITQMSAINGLVKTWQEFDGINVIAAQPFAPTGSVTAATGGVASDKIDESHVLMVVQVATTSIFAFVARVDSAGKPIIPDQSTWTTVTTTTITTATFPQVCVLPGAADAIVSFAATRGGVFCQVLVSLGINPSTFALTLGTEQTVRGTEVVTTAGEVKGLSATNFGLVFRTNAANILYAYQLSLAAGVITVGTLPLTIETGNATASNQRMAFKDSTHLDLIYRSTVTATSGFGYVARITFNGTGSLPTISSLLQVASAIGPANSNGLRLIPIPGATDYLIAVISGPTGISNFIAQPVHVNAGTPVLAGTAFTSETYWGLTSISAAMPEAGTLVVAAFTTNCAGYYILAVDSSYNITAVFRWNTDAAANAPSKANMIPVNNGKHIFFSFVQITSNFPCASILRP